jgi:hypothetical protein
MLACLRSFGLTAVKSNQPQGGNNSYSLSLASPARADVYRAGGQALKFLVQLTLATNWSKSKQNYLLRP